MTVRLVVTGATGEMGGHVLSTAADRDDVTVVAAVDRDDVAGTTTVEGMEVDPVSDLPRILTEREPTALVDFTVPAATLGHVAACADAGVPAVIGTTGFDDEELETLREAAERTAVLKSTNFARGVAALRSAVVDAVRNLPGYDIEVTETHHNRKLDAPSGTAKTLLEDIEREMQRTAERSSARSPRDEERATAGRVHGREGEAPREAGEIGVHARRAGTIRGEHEVMLAGNHEVLRLVHRAEDRGVFAAGALDAAAWLPGRGPGWYDFSQVLSHDEP